MIAHLKASKPMPGRWLYIIYPLLTAAVTLAANELVLELISHPATTGIEFPLTMVGLAGLLLIPAFLIHATLRLRTSQQTTRLFALGPAGITLIAALQLVIVLVLSNTARFIMLILIFGGL